MFTRTLFFTIVFTFFASYAADDKMITLQSNDGACITIPQAVAKHSVTLAHLLDGPAFEQAVLLDIFNAQEVKLLVDVLNTIHQATSEQNAIASVRTMITTETEPTLAALHDFFDIEIARKALAEHFFYGFNLHKTEGILQKATAITKICENLWANSIDENADITTQKNAALVHRLIENTRLIDKKNFLTSKGKQIGLLFTGVSVGEAADYGLINMNYRPADTLALVETDGVQDDNVSGERLGKVLHFDVNIIGDYITFLEGFAPTAPIDITQRQRAISIYKTNIWHLSDNNFQHAQDPERLLIYRNKIASIDSHAFQGLRSLKELNLSSNKLTFIPAKLFAPLVNLKELCLSNNPISHLHADMFKECKKLQSLSLLDTHIPQEEINALRTALPNVKIYVSLSPLVASNYSLINS